MSIIKKKNEIELYKLNLMIVFLKIAINIYTVIPVSTADVNEKENPSLANKKIT